MEEASAKKVAVWAVSDAIPFGKSKSPPEIPLPAYRFLLSKDLSVEFLHGHTLCFLRISHVYAAVWEYPWNVQGYPSFREISNAHKPACVP
ncbi:MAG: hypothetical protein IKT58_03500 [Oscillospiraceae bacterium]|nr:hypothetical protein [Oscillospiraceae bacterium]